MINRDLVVNVNDQTSLLELLRTNESRGGLGWPIAPEFAFEEVPEIADGIPGNAKVTVSRLIPAGVENEHLVILAEFDQEYVRRDLREILRSLRRYIRESAKFADYTGLGDTVFIVAAPDYGDLRFVLFEERANRQPQIKSFGWRKEFVGRTVLTHNLDRLHWASRAQWSQAWDVDALTELFYVDYEQVFRQVYAQVQGAPDDKTRHSWTQLLFNRLLFLAFIQRMGTSKGDLWLHLPGGTPGGFLFDLYARPSLPPFASKYSALKRVFLELDLKEDDQFKNRDADVLGEIPYLNGGLFDKDDPLDLLNISVPDEALAPVLAEKQGLFARYNFTVTESTPLDQEVAIDPEMLGKIFERLIIKNERHGSGTYYTPRPIVAFMVNEALKGYLTERGLPAEKAAILVDEDRVQSPAGQDGPAFLPSEMQDTLDWLFEVRAVDPACGSGAYLLMLLQRLFDLVDRLEVSRDKRRDVSQKHHYETKLRLLQRCVYGVDLSETAIRIARLRMWLSLVVENKGEKPDPLPNFDFLIMQGDSLASPLFPLQNVLGYPEQEIREYAELKRRFFHPEAGEERPTQETMRAKRKVIADAFDDQLSNNKLRSASQMPFDWEVDFAEVFDPHDSEETTGGSLNLGLEAGSNGQGELAARVKRASGFDIVLANPPYVNSGELLRNVGPAYKSALVAAYPKTATGTADLLVYFMERAVDLLRPGGQFAFITSNKWLKAAYGKKLRGQLAVRTRINHLIDFNDLPVFKGTIAYPLITLAAKRAENDKGETVTRFTSVSSPHQLEEPLPEIIADWGGDLPPGSLGNDGGWQLVTGEEARRLAKMRERGIPLGEYVKGRIYRGILTGLNEVKIGSDGQMYGKSVPPGVKVVRKEGVFVIDGKKRAELIAEDPKSEQIIKPLATGRDIKKWRVEQRDRWIIFARRGINIDDFPAIKKHLQKFKVRLEPRDSTADSGVGRKPGRYKWFELQDDTAYWRAFEDVKIVFPDISPEPRFTLSQPGQYIEATAFIIARPDFYLAGILSSKTFSALVESAVPKIQNGFLRYKKVYLEPLVIATGNEDEKAKIEELVVKILDAKAAEPDANVSELEAEIDRRVEFLYFGEGDSYEEALAKEQAEIRAMLRPGIETATLEFKETLWHDVRLGTVHGDHVIDVMKAVSAMLNRDGGTVLIGVDDDAQIIGIERDLEKLETLDKFQRKFQESFGIKLRPDPSDLVRIRFVEIDGKTIARIDIKPDHSTMFTLNEKVYIRRDGESRELSSVDTALWWQRRQKGEE